MENKQGKLKKKLFILGSYLIVSLILFIYVSYSAYRIKITGTIIMPQTESFNACINIDETKGAPGLSITSAALTLENYKALTGIGPGMSVEQFALEQDDNHRIVVNVSNSDSEGSYCKLNLSYNLSIKTTGMLPLTFYLVDKQDNSTAEAITYITYDETQAIFKINNEEAEFHLSNDKLNTNSYEIYVGWNDNDANSYNAKLCRELDKITIVANIWADPSGASWTEDYPPNITVTTMQGIN